MTTLPAINAKGNRASITSAKERATSNVSRRNMRFMTWRERELVKQQKIRDEKPAMSKVDTSIYRNSYKHNMCVEMLKEGFHKSFEELFNLIEQRKTKRLEAGVDSVLWHEKSLEEQSEKLDQLWLHLTKAEAALRVGKWEEVYAARHQLAQFFLSTGDQWLSDHFFKSALEFSLNIRLDGGRREAEANCNMGLAFERNEQYKLSAEHLEKFHQLSVGRNWTDETSLPHSSAACQHLSRIYTALSDATSDLQEKQNYLNKAYSVAKEGSDAMQEARAALKLGQNYELMKDSETAIEYLNHSLETAQDLHDNELIGEACEALAKSHQTQGNVSRSIECLEIFAKTSRDSGRKTELVNACNCLGVIYNTMGHYDNAVNHFTSAYQVSNELGELSEESSVLLGVAQGNAMLNAFKHNMEIPPRHMMDRIIDWKNERSNEFGNPLPSVHVSQPSTPPRVPDPTEPFREVEGSDVIVTE
ncbi:LOW QUALITY PROTEIN: tetratricopeptide repeat protein 29-like [Ciona intestinalis]